MLAVAYFHQSQGQAYTGSCENAGRGQTFHKCEMKCNFDGSCEEFVSEESCGCDGQAYFAGVTNFFQVCCMSEIICFFRDINITILFKPFEYSSFSIRTVKAHMELVRGGRSGKVLMSAIICKLGAEIAQGILQEQHMQKKLILINFAKYFYV